MRGESPVQLPEEAAATCASPQLVRLSRPASRVTPMHFEDVAPPIIVLVGQLLAATPV
jgi:hypothetical protein